MSGLSIKTGWSDAKRIIAKYPGEVRPLDEKQFAKWIEDADHICQLHNASLPANV